MLTGNFRFGCQPPTALLLHLFRTGSVQDPFVAASTWSCVLQHADRTVETSSRARALRIVSVGNLLDGFEAAGCQQAEALLVGFCLVLIAYSIVLPANGPLESE